MYFRIFMNGLALGLGVYTAHKIGELIDEWRLNAAAKRASDVTTDE